MVSRIRVLLAKVFAGLFFKVVDPDTEAALSRPEEYADLQEIRRREVERCIIRYLGPARW